MRLLFPMLTILNATNKNKMESSLYLIQQQDETEIR